VLVTNGGHYSQVHCGFDFVAIALCYSRQAACLQASSSVDLALMCRKTLRQSILIVTNHMHTTLCCTAADSRSAPSKKLHTVTLSDNGSSSDESSNDDSDNESYAGRVHLY
jgi:hypothetical protein